MTSSDDQLLDFDASKYAHYDESEARQNLEAHGDLFRGQLRVARSLDTWALRLPDEGDADFRSALNEVAAHIRQGDYLPGAAMA